MDHSTGAALKWGLSPLDWCHHAIDVHADHPVGVLIARCGHRLLIVTALDADRPGGQVCATCSRWTTRW